MLQFWLSTATSLYLTGKKLVIEQAPAGTEVNLNEVMATAHLEADAIMDATFRRIDYSVGGGFYDPITRRVCTPVNPPSDLAI